MRWVVGDERGHRKEQLIGSLIGYGGEDGFSSRIFF